MRVVFLYVRQKSRPCVGLCPRRACVLCGNGVVPTDGVSWAPARSPRMGRPGLLHGPCCALLTALREGQPPFSLN